MLSIIFFLKASLLNYFLLFSASILPVHSNSIIDDKTLLDLEIIPCGERTSLFDTINRTLTTAGRLSLKARLSTPIDSVDELTQRQDHLRFFFENNKLLRSLKSHFQKIAQHEIFFNAIEKTESTFLEKALDGVYFSSKKLHPYNTQPWALNAAYALHATGLCLPLAEYLVMHTSLSILFNAHHDAHACSFAHNRQEGILKYYGAHAAIFACHASGLYAMKESLENRAFLTKKMQQYMIHVAEYINEARAVYRFLKNEHIVKMHFKPYVVLDNFFADTPKVSADCRKLCMLLKKSTFTGEPSVWNNAGNIFAAYKLYRTVKHELTQLTDALGEVDMYLSLAQLISEQTAENPWSYAQYKSDAIPSLTIYRLRHLFIPQPKSKSWNICTHETGHHIITGNNGVGKSTYIHGFGQALILAQTCGIAPAQIFNITPFSNIQTYRFIQDDFAAGTSRFYAECGRIEKILETIEQEPSFCCVLLDEPFTSTNAIKGTHYLHETLARLLSTRHVISFTVTHHIFDGVTYDCIQPEHIALN